MAKCSVLCTLVAPPHSYTISPFEYPVLQELPLSRYARIRPHHHRRRHRRPRDRVPLSRTLSRQARHRARKGSRRSPGIRQAATPACSTPASTTAPARSRRINCRAGKARHGGVLHARKHPLHPLRQDHRRHRTSPSCRGWKRSSNAARKTASSATASAPNKSASSNPTAAGLAGIHIPEAGVVDYGQVAQRLAEIVTEQGSQVVTERARHRHPPRHRPRGRRNHRRRIRRRSRSSTAPASTATASRGSAARQPSAMIIPFRGEFYALPPEEPASRPHAHLPRARPEIPVPRRPLHAADQRPRRMRPERRPRLRPRRLPQHHGQRPRPGRNAHVPRLLAARDALLADRRQRNVAQLQQAGLRPRLQRLVPAIESNMLWTGPPPASAPKPSAATAPWSTTSSSKKPTASST